jgi:hypothetical protein
MRPTQGPSVRPLELPVKMEGLLPVVVHEEHSELMLQALVVRLLVVLELLRLLQELTKLVYISHMGENFHDTWEVLAENFLDGLHLQFEDVRILFELVGAADALPGEVPPQKLDYHVGNRL